MHLLPKVPIAVFQRKSNGAVHQATDELAESKTLPVVVGAAEPSVEADAGDQASALNPEKKWAARIRSHLEAGVAGYIAAGLEAIQAKRDLKKRRGFGFIHMIEAELGENIDAVEKWMAIARNPYLADSANLRNLPTAWTTLYILSPLKPKVLEELVEVGRLHPALTGAGTTELVRLVRALNSSGRKRDQTQGCDRDHAHDSEVDDQDDQRGGDCDGHHGAGHGGDHSHDQKLGEDHGDDHGRGLGDGRDGDLGDGRGKDLGRDVGDDDRPEPVAGQENAARRDAVGTTSRSELERLSAQIDELTHKLRVRDIRIHALEGEIADLKTAAAEAQSADLVAVWRNGTDAELAAGLSAIGLDDIFRVKPDWKSSLLTTTYASDPSAARLVDLLQCRLERDGVNAAVQLRKIRALIDSKPPKMTIDLTAVPAAGKA